jgi:7,8-dihydro-6-hydroxymethylpterin dimethyltransferase
MQPKKTNDYLFKGETRSLCPECMKVIVAKVHERGNKLYLDKFCPEHGKSTALLSSDAAWTDWSQSFNKPGEVPHFITGKTAEGCPDDCGLCESHEQHSCSIQIEITDKCDLTCHNCYMGPQNKWFLPKERAEWMFDRMVQMEGSPEIVQLTGGEPTLHPDLFDIAKSAVARNIKYVLINTNGNRIAKEYDFAQRLADEGLYVYFQFDGFRKEIYETMRGKDLLATKLQALENLEKAGVNTVLTPTIEKGVNDDQLGEIIRLATSKKFIKGVSFQPISYVKHYQANEGSWSYKKDACADPFNRITMQDMIKGIAAQMNGLLEESDFVPVPCHQPSCGTVTYVVEGDNGMVPLTRILQVDNLLDYVKNKPRVDMDEVFQASRMELEKLWSMSAIGGSEKVLHGVRNLLTRCCGTDMDTLGMFEDKITQVSIHHIMDAHNFDVNRSRKCCVHFMLPSGKLIPFCNYNNIYRDKYRANGMDKSMEFVDLRCTQSL